MHGRPGAALPLPSFWVARRQRGKFFCSGSQQSRGGPHYPLPIRSPLACAQQPEGAPPRSSHTLGAAHPHPQPTPPRQRQRRCALPLTANAEPPPSSSCPPERAPSVRHPCRCAAALLSSTESTQHPQRCPARTRTRRSRPSPCSPRPAGKRAGCSGGAETPSALQGRPCPLNHSTPLQSHCSTMCWALRARKGRHAEVEREGQVVGWAARCQGPRGWAKGREHHSRARAGEYNVHSDCGCPAWERGAREKRAEGRQGEMRGKRSADNTKEKETMLLFLNVIGIPTGARS